MNKIISFPHIDSYYIPIKYILSKITKCKIYIPKLNNQNTIYHGSKHSPQDVCMPFKYNLGNYLDALSNGANILIQAGGGCRYGYFAELQEAILESLGYNFTFINLIKDNHISLVKLYKFAKEVNPKLNIFTYIYYLVQGFLIIIFMDKLNNYQRLNEGNSLNPQLFETLKQKMYKSYQKEKLSITKIISKYYYYKKKYHEIPQNSKENSIKILLIGELYTLMDSEANNHLEKKLIKEGITIYRYTDLTYLLLKKKFSQPKILNESRKYLKYSLGADGTESVYHTLKHCKNGIDGIIHIKSYGCVPEINAIPIISKICSEYKVPIIYLSFDGENNVANIETKLEAFYEMIKIKKNKF